MILEWDYYFYMVEMLDEWFVYPKTKTAWTEIGNLFMFGMNCMNADQKKMLAGKARISECYVEKQSWTTNNHEQKIKSKNKAYLNSFWY